MIRVDRSLQSLGNPSLAGLVQYWNASLEDRVC